MRSLLLVAALLACKSSPSVLSRDAVCARFAAKTAVANDWFERQLSTMTSEPAHVPKLPAKLIEADCKSRWSDAMVECARQDDVTLPGCDELPWAVMRTLPPKHELPAGPPAVATHELSSRSDELVIGDRGLVVVSDDSGWSAFDATASRRWHRDAYAQHGVSFGDVVLLFDGDAFVAVADDGTERWQRPVPRIGAQSSYLAASLTLADQVYAVLADGRVLRVNPKACADGAATCIAVAFVIELPAQGSVQLARGPDETLLVLDSQRIRGFSASGAVTFELVASGLDGATALPSGEVAVVVDETELVVVAPPTCGTAPIALKSAPAGCAVTRIRVGFLSSRSPLALPDNSLVVTTRGDLVLRYARNGELQWISLAGLQGTLTSHRDQLLGISDRGALVSLDAATGHQRWATTLRATTGNPASYRVAVSGPWIIVAAPHEVTWIAQN